MLPVKLFAPVVQSWDGFHRKKGHISNLIFLHKINVGLTKHIFIFFTQSVRQPGLSNPLIQNKNQVEPGIYVIPLNLL